MAKQNVQSINSIIKKNNIEIIDLKAIDLAGRLQHISLPVYPGIISKLLKEGVGFDGSSYGYAKVENSDMVLVSDLDTAVIDPFREIKTLSFYTHIRLTDKKPSPFNQDVTDHKINYLPRDFEEALESLEADNEFLLRGNIFTKDLLTQWENIKHEEIKAIGTMPHPFEYKMYFTL